MKKYLNFRVRLRNPVFYVQLGVAILTPLLAYTGLNAQDITSWGVFFDLILKAVSNPYLLMLVVASVWTAVTDPTTRGLKDSTLVLKKGSHKK